MIDIKANHENEENFNIDEWLYLDDFYKWEFDEESDDKIIINGIKYDYEMTLLATVPDSLCMRVLIDDIYYHFG